MTASNHTEHYGLSQYVESRVSALAAAGTSDSAAVTPGATGFAPIWLDTNHCR